jgi:hypothetical protein
MLQVRLLSLCLLRFSCSLPADRKILDMLPDRKPQVTFSCDQADHTCNFQFWVGGQESFYCSLDDCDARAIATRDQNATQYTCQSVQCRCIPDRMLCGESGSVGECSMALRNPTWNASADISDFLVESIKGPGKFTCRTDGQGCKFEEPEMNNLINDIFGDGYITLGCNAGECMHYPLVPGFVVRLGAGDMLRMSNTTCSDHQRPTAASWLPSALLLQEPYS